VSFPALEGAGKGALIRKAREEGDLGQAVVRFPQQASCKVPACHVHNALERVAAFGQASLQRPAPESQFRRDRRQRWHALAEHAGYGASDLLLEPVIVGRRPLSGGISCPLDLRDQPPGASPPATG